MSYRNSPMPPPRRPQRTGLTLVEVLVVASIVLLLFTMCAPAISQPRWLNQRSQCINNQRNLTLAIQQYNVNETRLPGWAEPMLSWEKEPAALPTSWVFPILPYIERSDVYRPVIQRDAATYNTNPHGWPATAGGNPHIRVLRCPADPTATNSGMNISYVANAGYRDGAAETIGPFAGGFPNYDGPLQDGPASAVFLNRYRAAASPRTHTQSLEWIASKEGTSNTLLFSENIHAGRWDLQSDAHPNSPPREGFVAFHFANSTDGGPKNLLRINAALSSHHKPSEYEGTLSGASSYHPKGVVASFCDGHTPFIAQEIDWKTWTLLFTPHGDGLKTTWPDGVGETNVFDGAILTERF